MAGDHHHLVRLLAAAQLGDHVGRVGLALEPRLHRERRGQRFARRRHPPQPHRVLDRDRRGRNLRDTLGVAERARVRRGDRALGRRAHERRDRPELRGLGRPVAPEAHGLVVALPVGGVDDDLALHSFPAERLELLLVANDHERSGEASRGRADAHPQAEHRQLALYGCHEPQRFAPSHPARDLRGLQPHALEAFRTHLGAGPGDRLLEAGRSAQPMADARRHVLELAPRTVVGERARHHAQAELAVAGREVVLGREGRRRGESEDEQEPAGISGFSRNADVSHLAADSITAAAIPGSAPPDRPC